LSDKEICFPLKDFEFTNENQYFDPILDFNKEPTVEDLYDFGQNTIPEDDVSVGGGGDDFDYDFGPLNESLPEENDMETTSPLPVLVSLSQEKLFSYFDTNMIRSWAGPEHWRSRPFTSNVFFL
jgi:hypothetical protein